MTDNTEYKRDEDGLLVVQPSDYIHDDAEFYDLLFQRVALDRKEDLEYDYHRLGGYVERLQRRLEYANKRADLACQLLGESIVADHQVYQ